MSKSFIVASFGDSELLFPAQSELCMQSHRIRQLLPPTVIKRNKLVHKRIEDRAKERVEMVQYKPQSTAGAVSRLSSQVAPLGVTPSTPPTPDVVVAVDPLMLAGTRKRKSAENEKKIALELVQASGRLSSIKT